MVWTQVSKLPLSSVAFQVRVMTPVLPQPGAKASVWLMATLPRAEVRRAGPGVAGGVSPVHSTVVLAGQVIDGLVVSTTVMVWSQVSKLPLSSVAFQVRVMTPVLPGPGANLSVWLTATLAKYTLPYTTLFRSGVVSPVHSTVVLAGQV